MSLFFLVVHIPLVVDIKHVSQVRPFTILYSTSPALTDLLFTYVYTVGLFKVKIGNPFPLNDFQKSVLSLYKSKHKIPFFQWVGRLYSTWLCCLWFSSLWCTVITMLNLLFTVYELDSSSPFTQNSHWWSKKCSFVYQPCYRFCPLCPSIKRLKFRNEVHTRSWSSWP